MKVKQTPIASAVALVLMGMAYQPAVQAQQSAQEEAATAERDEARDAKQMEVVVVTGIRASLEKSLAVKRDSDSVVEVITAEDIGKMPDKNVADSLQRLPGVTISSASASEGGFDENDRVSLRGTNPSLTQTMIDGHMIGSGDWFVLNQVGTVGRSVSYSLLPSELVGQVIVRKSAQANIVEGGVAGTVDIITRQPLQFQEQLSAEASFGMVYSDLPDEFDPQFSALVNWKNPADSFGILVQGFAEKRSLRRDGQEMLGYSQIAPGSAIALSNPDLSGVYYPNAIGSALFEQERDRKGGLINIQGRPSEDLTLAFSAFSSHMEATNFNRNFIVWPSRILGGGAGQAPDPGYVVRNNTLVEANFSNIAGRQYAIDDQIYRPGANSESEFYNLDIEFLANDRLTLTGKIGASTGRGETPEQAVFEGDIFNTGATYRLNGLRSPADASIPLGNPAVFTGTTLDWIFGASPATTDDKERWAQIDGVFSLDNDTFNNLRFGARAAQHERDSTFVAQGPLWSADPFNVANLPQWNGETYPGNFGSGLGGGNFPRNVWQLDPQILRDWGNIYSNRDPVTRRYFPAEFAMEENNRAAYIMSDLGGDNWSGNIGVRVVQTEERVLQNVPIPGSVCPALEPCAAVPGAITTSAFGSFYQRLVENDYTDVLPSANFRFQLSDQLVGRLAAAKTMARPDFSSIGGAVDLNDTLLTGSGGNPNLKPIRSTNFDAALEWYYGPESLLSAGLFYMDLSSYVSYGVSNATYRNIRTGLDEVYAITSPVNGKGDIQGLELAWQQPLGHGFGIMANYTYADAEARKEVPTDTGELVGASRDTYNLAGYFENEWLNARVAYTYRSEFFNGLDRSTAQHQDEVGTLAASLGFRISERMTLSLDGLNLNRPVLKYYANNRDQPTAFYDNGRQFYLSLRVKM
jgi:iron complex outermembrane recepter protein